MKSGFVVLELVFGSGEQDTYKQEKSEKMAKYSFWLVLAVCHQVIIGQSDITFNNERFGCNCKLLTECDPINELVKAQKFNELRSNHQSCGFDRKIPKYW